MKKFDTTGFAFKCLTTTVVVLSLFVSCKREELVQRNDEQVIIEATASLPYGFSKMIYEDHYKEGKGILSGWKTGDTFLALEVNGSTVTPVTFTATAPADVKTTFTSSGAVAADANTVWYAVLGKKASFGVSSIKCCYSGQDGSLGNLENYDYITAKATGEKPDFDYAAGKHLTHLIKISLPEGVQNLEFNTCEGDNEFTVNSDGSVTPCIADYHTVAVKKLEMQKASTKGQPLYLAVPAIDYKSAGLIVTFFNADKTMSQGRALSADLSSAGGRMGTSDLSEVSLLDRPSANDAVDFISESSIAIKHLENDSYAGLNDEYEFKCSPKWAPFNLGAKANPTTAEEFYGEYFAWGEVGQKASYSWSNYKYSSTPENIGYKRNYIGKADITLTLGMICGTKYDAARVQWGAEWRLPTLEELLSILGNNEILSLTSGGKEEETDSGFYTKDLSSYNGVEVKGRSFLKNGRTIFLPYCGRFSYSEGGESTSPGQVSKMGYYYCGAHNPTAGSKDAYRLLVRANQIDPSAQNQGYGFSIRPVLATDSAEDPEPVKVTGHVYDKSTGRGIAGVLVSDGYTVCKTEVDGSYVLQADARARTINFTVPAAYEIPLDAEGKPAFFKKVNLSQSKETTVSIEFTPREKVSDTFTLVAVADAHVQTDSNLKRFKEECIADLQNTINELAKSGEAGSIIGIGLGDQLWDNLSTDMTNSVKSLYTGLKASGNTVPFFYCIGNHDHQSGVGKTDIAATNHFVNNFAPTDYSFDIGNAHIIVVDGIDYTGVDEGGSSGYSIIKYKERISGEKLHWIRQDIANVENKANKVAIFCTHAPFYNALGNSDAVKTELKAFNQAHVLTGHIHNLSNHFLNGFKCKDGRTIVERNIQSFGGMWHLADLSPNGTPAGYEVFTFKGKSLYSEYNKTIKEKKNFQMRVYNGNDSYNGYTPGSGVSKPKKNNTYEWDSKFNGKFLVRLWDGDGTMTTDEEMTWKVYFVKNGEKTLMQRSKEYIIDQCAASYIVNILGSPYGTGDKATATQWWSIDAPGGDPSTEKGWKIVAEHTLPGGVKQTYETSVLSSDYYGYPLGSRFITAN